MTFGFGFGCALGNMERVRWVGGDCFCGRCAGCLLLLLHATNTHVYVLPPTHACLPLGWLFVMCGMSIVCVLTHSLSLLLLIFRCVLTSSFSRGHAKKEKINNDEENNNRESDRLVPWLHVDAAVSV